jgi:predicted SnoaL-like aldol condensation-catalyzing enzyme
MTTPDQNVATVREFVQRVFNEHDVAFAEKTLADDFVDQSPPPGIAGTKAGMLEMFTQMSERFPDARSEVLDVVAAGDKVALRTRTTGTDTNGFMPGMPPTGKPFSMESIDMMTFNEAGMNTEHYGIADIAGVMMQLGLTPPSGGGSG